MDLENIMAVSGLPGLYKLVSSRSNGLVVSHMDEEKTRFCSVRRHQFSPLETVAIYTYSDSTEIKEIFKTMIEKSSDLPYIAANASSADTESYFRAILPEYDEDRVYVSDMKKVIKWFHFLNDRSLLSLEASSDEKE